MLCMALFATCISAQAQEKKLVREGNQLYQQQKYKDAANAYQQALQKNPASVTGSFNLGDALIQQKQYDAARKVMAATAKNAPDKAAQSGAHYNIGNTYMQEQKWQDAVNAYKDALRKNPYDGDAKYNLSYALEKMKQQQNKGGGKDNKQDQKDQKNQKNQQGNNNQDKNGKNQKDQQNKNGQQQNKDQQQQDAQQDKNGEQQQQQHPQPQPSKLSEQQAESMLNALEQDEKKLQDKMQKEEGVPVKQEKDW